MGVIAERCTHATHSTSRSCLLRRSWLAAPVPEIMQSTPHDLFVRALLHQPLCVLGECRQPRAAATEK